MDKSIRYLEKFASLGFCDTVEPTKHSQRNVTMTVYLQEIDNMPDLIAQYLHRLGNVGAVYASLFEMQSSDKGKYERCWQEIVALSMALNQRLNILGWPYPGGDTLGLFCAACDHLSSLMPNEIDQVAVEVAKLRRFATILRDEINARETG